MNTINRIKYILFVILALMGVFSCGPGKEESSTTTAPPHPVPPPIPPNREEFQVKLFEAIANGKESDLLALAEKTKGRELGSPFVFKDNQAMTPLLFTMHVNKPKLTLALLESQKLEDLHPWFDLDDKNAIVRIIEKAENDPLFKWVLDFLAKKSASQVKFLLADADTLGAILKTPVLKAEIENRNDIQKHDAKSSPSGFSNRGASCYANSSMQLLLLNPDYWQAAQNFYDHGPDGDDKDFTESVLDFRETLLSGYANSEVMKKKVGGIIDEGVRLGIFEGGFTRTGQNDAQEFLGKILNAANFTPIKTAQSLTQDTRWNQLFGNVSPYKDVPDSSHLPFEFPPSDKPVSLDQMFDFYANPLAKVEKVPDGAAPGSKNKNHTERNRLRAPGSDYLVIQVKRFFGIYIKDDDGKIIGLDTKRLDIDLELPEIINLGKYFVPELRAGSNYETIAIVNQSGSLSGGHYTASVKYGSQWFTANDSWISKTNWDSVKETAKKQAYLILLKLVQ